MSRLSRRTCRADAATLAQELLGCALYTELDGVRTGGMIVEAEAYVGVEDRAAHCFGDRRTPRTEAMYADGGTSYVYFTYGMHHCFNVVCEREDVAGAVLVRALEPTVGLDTMRTRRAARRGKPVAADKDLCSGPGKLCQALGIDLAHNGRDLTTDAAIWIDSREREPTDVVRTTRVGIGDCGEWSNALLRWYMRRSIHVSKRNRAMEAP